MLFVCWLSPCVVAPMTPANTKFFKSQTGLRDEGRTRRQAERRTCLCHEEAALPLEKQRALQKQRPIAEAKNVKNSKSPRAERNFVLTFFLLKKSMRAARAIVKTRIAGCHHVSPPPPRQQARSFCFSPSLVRKMKEGQEDKRNEEHALAMMCPGRFKHT